MTAQPTYEQFVQRAGEVKLENTDAQIADEVRRDPGFPFRPTTLRILADMRRDSLGDYHHVRGVFAREGVPVRDLDEAVERVGTQPNGAAPEIDFATLCLSPAEWEARDIPPEDKLLGPFSTTTRSEISADTGLGKTMLALGMAHAMALGRPFLHWQPGRAGRVLYVDAEMPRELIQARLALARSWFGLSEPLGRDRLCLLSTEDIETMPPLDTPEGARWLLDFMDKLGRFDHVTLDNRQALAAGDLSADDASTQALKHLQRELTKQRNGQLWAHHTGYDTTRGYGRKSREWELDTVAVGEKLEDQHDADVAMRLTFKKARRRTPENRDDYQPVEITLLHGEWLWAPAEAKTKAKEPAKPWRGERQRVFVRQLRKLADKHPEGVERSTLRSHFLCELNAERTRDGQQPLTSANGASAFRQVLMHLREKEPPLFTEHGDLIQPTTELQ